MAGGGEAEYFCAITSASKPEALFFLESHNWDLHAAVAAFYDDGPELDPTDGSLLPTIDTSFDSLSWPSLELSPLNSSVDLLQSASPGEIPDQNSGEGSRGQSLASWNCMDVDTDKAFLQSPETIIFSGTWLMLRDEDAALIPPLSEQSQHSAHFYHHTVHIWRDGFTVDGGVLRKIDHPANACFLEKLRESKCPEELEPRCPQVRIDIITHEEYFTVCIPGLAKSHTASQGLRRNVASEMNPTGYPSLFQNIASSSQNISSSHNIVSSSSRVVDDQPHLGCDQGMALILEFVPLSR